MSVSLLKPARDHWGQPDYHWTLIRAIDVLPRDPEIEHLHAHYSRQSSDCDGSYYHENIVKATDIRVVIDESSFCDYMVSSTVNFFDENGTLTVEGPHSFTWSKRTDEGGECVSVQFCSDPDCNEPAQYRDYRAESMGY
jgi:hypothetical protein